MALFKETGKKEKKGQTTNVQKEAGDGKVTLCKHTDQQNMDTLNLWCIGLKTGLN